MQSKKVILLLSKNIKDAIRGNKLMIKILRSLPNKKAHKTWQVTNMREIKRAKIECALSHEKTDSK